MCKRVEVRLPELIVRADLLTIDLGKMDEILGMLWLCSTGFMAVHWPKTITFLTGNKPIILKGI